jgi:hypothetical protein
VHARGRALDLTRAQLFLLALTPLLLLWRLARHPPRLTEGSLV